jgi:hypothetical protein
MEASPTKTRRWFSFSLRTLFVVMTVVCIWVGFKVNRARNVKNAIAEVERLGGKIVYLHCMDRPTIPPPEPPGPKWLRNLIGDEFFVEVLQIELHTDQANDETIALIAKLPRMDSLVVTSNSITDKGMAHLAQATSLLAWDIKSDHITPSCLSYLHGLPKLITVVLRSAKADDSWMPACAALSQLKYLALQGTAVTDSGLVAIENSKNLEAIVLEGTPVTASGVDRLRKILPKCNIEWSND